MGLLIKGISGVSAHIILMSALVDAEYNVKKQIESAKEYSPKLVEIYTKQMEDIEKMKVILNTSSSFNEE